MIRLIDQRTGSVLVEDLIILWTFLGRLRGFAFYKIPEPGTAMLFLNTRRIHTFGMHFPLDIYYFDISLKVLGKRLCVKPYTFPTSPKGSRHIMEIPTQETKRPISLKNGEQLSLVFGVRF